MSAYCSPDDIEPVIPRDRLASLVGIDNAGSGGSEYTGAIQRYITMASNEIESVLGSLYTLPITGAQSLLMLKNICAVLAAGYIYQMNTSVTISEEMQKLVDAQRKLLNTYGDGGCSKDGQWVSKSLPDAPSQDVGPAIVSPLLTEPYTENIAFGTFGTPATVEVNT